MREIKITANDAGRRLDRFLRKYLPGASLGEIYKIIRKDVKVDSKRRPESYILNEDEMLSLYLSDETLASFGAPGHAGSAKDSGAPAAKGPHMSGARSPRTSAAKRTFTIIYEDDEVLVAGKPFGLLTHGDSSEKKNHLANQVKDYLIASGSYDPRSEKVFAPAPVNRLDRNTTGIVLFGKTSAAMRELSRMIREDEVRKFYLTIACGEIKRDLHLGGTLTKDGSANKVSVNMDGTAADTNAKAIETIVRPLENLTFRDGSGNELKTSLCEVELVTGRSHQIRAHLASVGHPLIGDSKYASGSATAVNNYVRKNFGLTTQLLHAGRIEFLGPADDQSTLGYLAGRSFEAPVPKRFREILSGLGSRSPILRNK